MVDVDAVIDTVKGVGGIGITHAIRGKDRAEDGAVVVRMENLHGIAAEGVVGVESVMAEHADIISRGGEGLAIVVEGADADEVEVELAGAKLGDLFVIDIDGIAGAGIDDGDAVGGI